MVRLCGDQVIDAVIVVSLDAMLAHSAYQTVEQARILLCGMQALAETHMVIQKRSLHPSITEALLDPIWRNWYTQRSEQRTQIYAPPLYVQVTQHGAQHEAKHQIDDLVRKLFGHVLWYTQDGVPCVQVAVPYAAWVAYATHAADTDIVQRLLYVLEGGGDISVAYS